MVIDYSYIVKKYTCYIEAMVRFRIRHNLILHIIYILKVYIVNTIVIHLLLACDEVYIRPPIKTRESLNKQTHKMETDS